MYINRAITEEIKSRFFKGKIIVLYGPRQVGKTTLIQHILGDFKDKKVKIVYGDDFLTQNSLINPSIVDLETYTKGYDILYIDEAQYITNIGVTLKLLNDHIKNVQVIATGSSSFELANKIVEPLTGRHFSFNLSAFSVGELVDAFGKQKIEESINTRLIYGSYPEIILSTDDIDFRLKEITNDYTSKDILRLDKIRNTEKLVKLLQALALQIGSEVSYNEISINLSIDRETIERYVSILEQSFIIFKLEPYSRNTRRSLKRMRKIYFWDLGIRNALINNLNSIELRSDKGHLFENFIISEFLKKDREKLLLNNYYFYRSYGGEEIDLIVEKNSELKGYECKYDSKQYIQNKSVDAPVKNVEVITSKNFINFLS